MGGACGAGDSVAMSVVYLGGMNLLSAVPGVGEALGGLTKTINQLDLFKADKTGLMDQAMTELNAVMNVFNQAKAIADAGMDMLKKADAVLDEARGLVTGLLSSLGGAGVGMYRFDGDLANMGSELTVAMRDQGASGKAVAIIIVANDGGAVSAMTKLFNMG